MGRSAVGTGGEAARPLRPCRRPPAGPRATPRRSGISGCAHRRRATPIAQLTSTDLRVPPFSMRTLIFRVGQSASRPVCRFVIVLADWRTGGLTDCLRRSVRRRTAPPSCVALPARSPSTRNAAFDSFASRVSRTAVPRESSGAPSSTTSANALLRSRMSAHHAARVGSCGRIIHTPWSSPRCVQSRGSSVRCA